VLRLACCTSSGKVRDGDPELGRSVDERSRSYWDGCHFEGFRTASTRLPGCVVRDMETALTTSGWQLDLLDWRRASLLEVKVTHVPNYGARIVFAHVQDRTLYSNFWSRSCWR
jgi:hypothetical protein